MLFHEKLYKLRKERQLSQETMAELLGTSRQAVSKWENGQGFPETEKLLTLANTFEVSLDYLLKDSGEERGAEESGYYVSREMAEAYLRNQKQWTKRFCLGLFVLLLSIIPYFKMQHEHSNPLYFVGFLLIGGLLAMRGILTADERYKILGKETLFFDASYLKELKTTAQHKNRRYAPLLGVSLVCFMLSIIMLFGDVGLLPQDFSQGVPVSYFPVIAVLAISAWILFYSSTMLESYQLLVHNDVHVRGFWFRFSRKMKRKTDDFLQ